MIKYVQGDAVEAMATTGDKIIAHIVNDEGGWGKGFVVPLGNKYSLAKELYLTWNSRELGKVQFVAVAPGVVVANMCAQHGYSKPNEPAIRYEALEECLFEVWKFKRENTTIHMPRIGCGLAGGKWDKVSELIKTLSWEVYVYDI